MDQEKLRVARNRATADAVMSDLESSLHREQLRELLLRVGSELLDTVEEVLEDTELRKAVFLIGLSTAAGIVSAIVRRASR